MADGRKSQDSEERGTDARRPSLHGHAGRAPGADARSEAGRGASGHGPSAGGKRPAADAAALDELSDRVARLESELADVAAERDAYLDHLRRLQAEFDNYRKRVRRDEEALRKRAGEDVVEALLPVIDNMQRACEAAEHHDEGKVVEGVEMVTGQICSLLGTHGLQEIEAATGDRFDPTVHDAIMAQPSADVPEGHIAAVSQRGYMLHDKLLRPARVVVSSGPPIDEGGA
jgi:molecular chaperone GrpE